MDRSKEEIDQQIDSGLGGSFGPDVEEDDVDTCMPPIESLVIDGDNTPKDDSKLRKLMEQAFSLDEENDT